MMTNVHKKLKMFIKYDQEMVLGVVVNYCLPVYLHDKEVNFIILVKYCLQVYLHK